MSAEAENRLLWYRNDICKMCQVIKQSEDNVVPYTIKNSCKTLFKNLLTFIRQAT